MDLTTANELLSTLKDARPREVDSNALSQALLASAEHHYATRKGVSMKGVRGAPDWLGYETALWKLGEDIRRFLKNRNDLRGHNIVLDTCRQIATDPRFGKGRQNIVIMLGEFGGADYADSLGLLLSDKEVRGHALKALLKANIPGFSAEAQRILDGEKERWIKSAAEKYLNLGR